MKPTFFRLLAVFVAAFLAAPRALHAQPSASDRAAAETLFNQALELLENGKAADACPKLQESQRLDPGVGTLLYLADCYKQTGKTASAWATFREAAYSANAAGQKDREETATKEAEALEGTLSKLTISVEKPDTPGLRVLRDGQDVGRALWESPLPVDPGTLALTAEAPGMLQWKAEVVVPPGPGSTSVRIPALVPAPTPPPAAVAVAAAPPPPAPSPKPEARSGSTMQRGLGWLAIGVGGVGLVTGGIIGLVAKSNYESSKDACRASADDTRCSAEGVSEGEKAQGLATAATVVVTIGGTLFVGGVVLALTAPSSATASAPRVTLTARGGRTSGELAVEGTW